MGVKYSVETDTLSPWNGRSAIEGADVAENLVADFDDAGEVVGFTLEHAAELLGSVLSERSLSPEKQAYSVIAES